MNPPTLSEAANGMRDQTWQQFHYEILQRRTDWLRWNRYCRKRSVSLLGPQHGALCRLRRWVEDAGKRGRVRKGGVPLGPTGTVRNLCSLAAGNVGAGLETCVVWDEDDI